MTSVVRQRENTDYNLFVAARGALRIGPTRMCYGFVYRCTSVTSRS